MKDGKAFFTVTTPSNQERIVPARMGTLDSAVHLAHSVAVEGAADSATIYFCVPIGRSDGTHTTVDTNLEWLARAAQALEGAGGHGQGHKDY